MPPALTPPAPSAVKLPVLENGVADTAPLVMASPVVTKAYVPFRLASEYLPVGGGGLIVAPPPPQASVQRAAAATSAVIRRFIAHLAALRSGQASNLQRACVRSLGGWAQGRPA